MTHYSEDTLLNYTLDTLDETEVGAIDRHLGECSQCREIRDRIQRDLSDLGTIKLREDQAQAEPPPLSRKRAVSFSTRILRAAAILVLGFLAGYGAASLNSGERVTVLPYVAPVNQAVTAKMPVSCEPIYSLSTYN